MIREDKIKGEIKSRSKTERCKRISFRLVTFTVNFLVVIAGWTAIYYVNIY